MSCEKISGVLIAYLDGRANPEERRDVEGHLKLCAACRERAEEFQRLWQVMDEVAPIEPSLGFDARLRELLAAEPHRKAWSWLVPSPRLSFAVLLLAALTVWIGSRPQQTLVYPGGTPGSEEQFRMIKDLGVLENYEILSNFDVLSDVPAVQDISNQPQSLPPSQDDQSLNSASGVGQS